MRIGEPFGDGIDGGSHAWIGSGQESHNRYHERGGIQVIGAKRLRERSGLLTPTALEDSGADPLPRRCPSINPVKRIQCVGKFDGTVECHPAHELRVEEIPRASTYLPDALVRLLPTCCRRIGNLDQEGACDLIELTELVAEEASRAEELTVDIELALIPGPVADAHRSAGTPSSQVAECALAEVVLAANSEHDLELSTPPNLRSHCASHPGEEPVRFIGTGSDPERLQRQAGVTDPGVAVVPVALTPDGVVKVIGHRRRCTHLWGTLPASLVLQCEAYLLTSLEGEASACQRAFYL